MIIFRADLFGAQNMKIQSRAFFIIMIGAHNWRFDSAKVISILQ